MVAGGKATVAPGSVIDGRLTTEGPERIFVIETVSPGRVIGPGAIVGADVTPPRTVSGSWTAVTGSKVRVAAGTVTVRPIAVRVTAGPVTVMGAPVRVVSGATKIDPVVESVILGPAMVCAGTVIVWDGATRVWPAAVMVVPGRTSVELGRVTEGRPIVVGADEMTFVIETETIGRVTTKPLVVGTAVEAGPVPVAVAMMTSGSSTAVTGSRATVAAGTVTVSPSAVKVRAGAVTVIPGAVMEAIGAVKVPGPDATKLGTAMV